MKVRSEARPAGGGKSIAVELDDSDMQDLAGWSGFDTPQRFKVMSDRADALVVQYLLRRGDISREFAEQRLREIKQGHPS